MGDVAKCSICKYDYVSSSDHQLCFLLRYATINTAADENHTPDFTGRVIDAKTLADMVKTRNLARTLKIHVPDTNNNNAPKAPKHVPLDAQIIEEWCRFKDADAEIPIARHVAAPNKPAARAEIVAGNVYAQIDMQQSPSVISGYPSAMKVLCQQITDSKISPIRMMYTRGYKGEAALMLGAEFGMITTCDDDWTTILDDHYFTVYQLHKMGFTFVRMLLAGMDLDLFSRCGMDRDALHVIRFSIRAFNCARGTPEQLKRILGEDKDGKLPSKYVY